MNGITIVNARIATLAGPPGPRRGTAMRDLAMIERGWVRVSGDAIEAVGEGAPPGGGVASAPTIDADGGLVLPAFVDCHTHTCWAGDRFEEYEMKLGGASYLDILKSGGGIMSTVRAVRAAAEEELTDLLVRRLGRLAALGTATVEVKSGYGLDTATELKMLRAIRAAADRSPLRVRATFLGAHAIDPDNPRFIDETVDETLPAAVAEFPGIVCDAYCEDGAWSLDETRRLFERARDLGCPLRVHADQFNSLGMTPLAVEMGAVSVDHMEASTPDDIAALAGSATVGVALPCSGFHLDDRYAPARSLIDAGGALAIATNYNPGSAPTPSMPFTIALAGRKLRLTAAEALTCCTVNAAAVLGLDRQIGSIEPGKAADLQVWDAPDERELSYEFAGPGPRIVLVGGEIAHQRESLSFRPR